jgi:hypothetical protein
MGEPRDVAVAVDADRDDSGVQLTQTFGSQTESVGHSRPEGSYDHIGLRDHLVEYLTTFGLSEIEGQASLSTVDADAGEAAGSKTLTLRRLDLDHVRA